LINGKKVLAIIPARGGSKRLPRKNILDLGGKPLIWWTINAAKKSKYIDRVIVSTEDSEIGEVSKSLGAEVPFFRPRKLAQDSTTTLEVVVHLIQELYKKSEYYDYVVILQPTSPFRTESHIDMAFNQLMESSVANAVVSVCPVDHHPLWSNTLPKNKSMSFFLSKNIDNIRSQDLPDYYRLNGAIYISKVNTLCTEKTFFPKDTCYAFIMPQKDSIDIDTKEDFNLALLAIDNSIMEKADIFSKLYEKHVVKKENTVTYQQFSKYLSRLLSEK
jgi:CMP-N,N'-diacetyllegionaminic acid synthase